jgi:hypothetical protein
VLRGKVSRGVRVLAVVVKTALRKSCSVAFEFALGTMPAMRSNPSIERTPYGTLRVPPGAAHVER